MIYDLDGNVVKEDDIKFLQIYTGVEGEEKQGLCVGTENYICVNSKANEADQKASQKFLSGCSTVTAEKHTVMESLE